MQTPTFLVLGWIFIAIGNSAPDLDTDPFGNVALEPLIFPDEQETDSSGQTTDLDLGLFSDDNDQRDQTSEPESSFFLANDIDCDASNADSLQFFGKMRRSKACQSPPTGGVSALKADLTNKDDLIGFNKFINQEQPRGGLQESSEECPQEVFETSTIPVCTQKFTRLETQPRTVAGILFDVIPAALSQCPLGKSKYCCNEVRYEPVLPGIWEQIDGTTLLTPNELAQAPRLGQFIYNGYGCFPSEIR